MNNQELDQAIATAHKLICLTPKGEQRDSISKHLESLLAIQRQRADQLSLEQSTQ